MIDTELYRQIHMLMPIICVDIVVKRNDDEGDKILLIRRKKEPAKGKYWFPGGRILRDETPTEAARRILNTEVGLKVGGLSFLGYESTEFDTDPFGHGKGTHTINLVFSGNTSTETPALDKNHDNFIWVGKNYQAWHSYIEKFIGV